MKGKGRFHESLLFEASLFNHLILEISGISYIYSLGQSWNELEYISA